MLIATVSPDRAPMTSSESLVDTGGVDDVAGAGDEGAAQFLVADGDGDAVDGVVRVSTLSTVARFMASARSLRRCGPGKHQSRVVNLSVEVAQTTTNRPAARPGIVLQVARTEMAVARDSSSATAEDVEQRHAGADVGPFDDPLAQGYRNSTGFTRCGARVCRSRPRSPSASRTRAKSSCSR